MKRLKKQKMSIGVEDYIKANKKLAREEELQRNGGRWEHIFNIYNFICS